MNECWIVFYGPRLEYRSHACFDHGLVGNLAAKLHGIAHHFIEYVMTREELRSALLNSNVQAMLQVIRKGEGTIGDDGYKTLFGGGFFTSFDDHPRHVVHSGNYSSSAAGAYQFLTKTWDGLVAQYGFEDFSPQCQDEGAVALIAGRGALDDVIAGNLDAAIEKCNHEWASLPGSPYGQPTRTMVQAVDTFIESGGRLA